MTGEVDIRFSPEDPKWDFMIVSRYGETKGRQHQGAIACITVHETEHSRDMELHAIAACGRVATVYDLRGLDKYARRQLAEEARQ